MTRTHSIQPKGGSVSTSVLKDFWLHRRIQNALQLNRAAGAVKSFLNPSPMYDFHQAVGQYTNYKNLLRKGEPERLLFVAIPLNAYESFFVEEDIWALVEAVAMPLIVYDALKQEIHKWFIS